MIFSLRACPLFSATLFLSALFSPLRSLLSPFISYYITLFFVSRYVRRLAVALFVYMLYAHIPCPTFRTAVHACIS